MARAVGGAIAGLRANEVASLGLVDIDWRRGEMMVTGKGGRVEVVALPVDVAEAVARYLSKGRPRTSSRALFVKECAPFGPLTSNGIGEVVGRSCKRAGLPRFGPYQLRHLVATVTNAIKPNMTATPHWPIGGRRPGSEKSLPTVVSQVLISAVLGSWSWNVRC